MGSIRNFLKSSAFTFSVVLLLSAFPASSLVSQSVIPPSDKTVRVIEDNSFFIEEAYNQDERVVQRISSIQYSFTNERDLLYTFTQEWPLARRNHQISFTLPISVYNTTHPGGPGDRLLNYRYQLVDAEDL